MVDPEMIDHVNRVIRGFETIGAIVKVKGRESLIRDAGDTLKFIISLSKKSSVNGVVADGGWIETGAGIFPGGREATSRGQEATSKIGSGLVASEEDVIKKMRDQYGIELHPW